MSEAAFRKLVGSRIRAQREMAGITRAALAREAEVGGGHVSILRWESGRYLPSLESARRLAKRLDVSIDWLCGRDD